MNFFKKRTMNYTVGLQLRTTDGNRDLFFEITSEEFEKYRDKMKNMAKEILDVVEIAISTDKNLVYIPDFGVIVTKDFKGVHLHSEVCK